MAKKITVNTEVGTFTRQTARTYQAIVVVNGHSESRIDATLTAEQQMLKSEVRYWSAIVNGRRPAPMNYNVPALETVRPFTVEEISGFLKKNLDRLAAIEDGSERARRIEAAKAQEFFALCWCGRIDLARREAAREAGKFLDVRIYALDGTRVM
jgi:hypothetical protein